MLVVPEGAVGRCVLEGRFTRALYVYLDPAALSMSVPDALWLVDYGFRMPGVTSGPPSMAGSISLAVEQELWAERVSTLTDDPVQASLERAEGLYHLVQHRPVIEKILEEELPPDEYYDELGRWLAMKFPKADPGWLEHLVPVVAAFDAATASRPCIAELTGAGLPGSPRWLNCLGWQQG